MDDFAGFPAGAIALIQRGGCSFALKAYNAEAAGASAVIIFNQGNTPDREGPLIGVTAAAPAGSVVAELDGPGRRGLVRRWRSPRPARVDGPHLRPAGGADRPRT